jgi:3-oxoacyl-[acyl-carrier protein] reductase
MDSGLAGRVALVTGASGGIGGEVARALRAEGARVVAHFHRHRDRAQALVRELGKDCAALGADLTSESEVERLFHQAETLIGAVEVLVANAGEWPEADEPIDQMSLARWRQTIDTNLTSAFLCAREFFRSIRKSGTADPAMVLVGSTAGVFGEAGHADYACAKAGLMFGLGLSLKNEICRLAPQGRVNVVSPGWTRTPMAERFVADPARIRRALQTMPLRKVARAQDVAMAVVYLASSRLAGHVNGQVMHVAGGMEGRVLYDPSEIDLTKA